MVFSEVFLQEKSKEMSDLVTSHSGLQKLLDIQSHSSTCGLVNWCVSCCIKMPQLRSFVEIIYFGLGLCREEEEAHDGQGSMAAGTQSRRLRDVFNRTQEAGAGVV